MILDRLKCNTRLAEVDKLLQSSQKKYKNNNLRVDTKLTDTKCLIYIYRKLH